MKLKLFLQHLANKMNLLVCFKGVTNVAQARMQSVTEYDTKRGRCLTENPIFHIRWGCGVCLIQEDFQFILIIHFP